MPQIGSNASPHIGPPGPGSATPVPTTPIRKRTVALPLQEDLTDEDLPKKRAVFNHCTFSGPRYGPEFMLKVA